MLPASISVARIMDDIFGKKIFGDKHTFLDSLHDLRYREFARLNYGPWDKLNDNKPFIPGYGDKPLGAEFYPHDMTKDDFENPKQSKIKQDITRSFAKMKKKPGIDTVSYSL